MNWAHKTGLTPTIFIEVSRYQARKGAVMYQCVRGIHFVSYYCCSNGFRHCSDSVVVFVFLLDLGTVQTVWQFLFFIFYCPSMTYVQTNHYRIITVGTGIILTFRGAVLVEIIWWLDLQLPVQSVPIIINVVSSNAAQAR